ncbi:hypothetical protein DCC81_25250 [Chitinophaga parva]|uniref:Lipoprotein n=1 Tax=Chitinophaga parva TaxID=2169414 RepID=A0A2T7BB87_9BACT|nr:hypothetical protein [Chitinophaga parva]PUZ21317.1 hypothetical protein DCC81_25250 [Chitinophaga parva]
MKSILWLWPGLLVFSIAFAVMLSCQKTDQKRDAQKEQITQSLAIAMPAPPSGHGWVPEGSKIERAGNVLAIAVFTIGLAGYPKASKR